MKIQHGFLCIADLRPKKGTEAGKLRPVLIMQTDLLNATHHPSTWVLPCTTRLTGESILRVVLPKGMAGNDHECEVMIDQSRAIDNRRFVKALKRVPLPVLSEIKEKLRLLGEL